MDYFVFDFSKFSVLVLTQVATGIFMLGLGVVVLLHNFKSKVNRAFFLMTIPEFVWFLGFAASQISRNLDQAWFWQIVTYMGIINIPLGGYNFSRVYAKQKAQSLLLFLGILNSLFWMTLALIHFDGFFSVKEYPWGYYSQAEEWYVIFLFPFFFYLVMIAVNLLRLHRRTTVYLEKQVIMFLFFAFIIADMGAIDFIPAFFNTPYLRPVGYIPITLWIALVGYTLLKFRIWDVTFLAHKTLYYLSFSTIVLVVYALFFGFFLTIIHGEVDLSILVFNSVIFLLLTFVLGSLKERTQGFVNQVFYRQKIKYDRVIRGLNERLTELVDLKTLISTVFTTLQKELFITYITLLLERGDESGVLYPLKTTVRNKKAGLLIKGGSGGFFSALQDSKEGISKDELNSYPRYKSVRREGNQLFSLYRAELALPVIRRGRLMSVLFLGTYLRKKHYDPEDRTALMRFCRSLGVALENTELYQEIKTVSEMKSDIITIVSHQLRTPVTSIRWGIHLLFQGAYGALKQAQKDAAQQIYQKTLETVHMIDRLLNINRIERGKFVYNPEQVTLVPLIEEVVGGFKAVDARVAVSFFVREIPRDFTLRADKERVREIFEIVIDNAIKYSPEKKEIEVHISRAVFRREPLYYQEKSCDTSGVKVSVIDHGLGIPRADKQRLFTKFFRGRRATHFNTSGLGIGLSYAKSLIDLHKGLIRVKSSVGQGTQVDMYFPVASAQERPALNARGK